MNPERFVSIVRRDFQRLGSGCYGTVYGRDGWPYVIKIGYSRRSDGYWPWVQYARANPGRHVPRIILAAACGRNSYIVILERLIPVDHVDNPQKYIDPLWAAYDRVNDRSPRTSVAFPITLIRPLRQIHKMKNQYSFDLCSENAMLRVNGTSIDLVITDPLGGKL